MAAAARKRQARAAPESHLEDVSRPRNRRVRNRPRGWAKKRKSKIDSQILFAAAASSHRRALQLTLTEVGKAYKVTAGAVCRWESGCFFLGWSVLSLKEYERTCNRLARS